MKFSGVVLAGGKSRRMGFPKHLIEIDGIPLWRRQMDLLRVAGANPIALSLNSEQPSPDPSLEIVRDTYPHCGPLGGIAAALTWSRHSHVIVLAVDLPLMTLEVIQKIAENCDEERGCVPRLSDAAEPLVAIYPRSSLNLLVQRLESGHLAARGFVEACAGTGLVCLLDTENIKPFENLNSPDICLGRKFVTVSAKR